MPAEQTGKEAAKYLTVDIIKKWIEDTYEGEKPNPLEASCDTAFKLILECYFTLGENFMTDTQGYPDSDVNRTKYNISVKALVGDQIKTTLVVEAKRFPNPKPADWETDMNLRCWTEAKQQLLNYMLLAMEKEKWGKCMEGIVMVGNRVQFYQLETSSTQLRQYKSAVVSRRDMRKSFCIKRDSKVLEKLLLEILQKVERRRGLRLR